MMAPFDVLAAGHLGVESGAHFEEARDAAPCADGAGGGGGHSAEEFEERTFASSVPADDAYDIALFHFEIDVLESPDVFAFAFVGAVIDFAYFEIGVFAAQHFCLPESVQIVAERPCAH